MDVAALIERLRQAYPGRGLRPHPRESVPAAGGHHPVRAVHGRARVNMVTPTALRPVPRPGRDERRLAGGARGDHPLDGVLPEQGQVHPGRIPAPHGGVRRRRCRARWRSCSRSRAWRGRPRTWFWAWPMESPAGVVVDTHVHRIAKRLGLTRGGTAEEVERDLMRVLPRDEWILFSHLLIVHGRRTCVARKPKCSECAVKDLCPSAAYFSEREGPAVGEGQGGIARREARRRAVGRFRNPRGRRPRSRRGALRKSDARKKGQRCGGPG